MNSSASPEWADPLSEKSGKFCGPSAVVAHDEPDNRSVDGSV